MNTGAMTLCLVDVDTRDMPYGLVDGTNLQENRVDSCVL